MKKWAKWSLCGFEEKQKDSLRDLQQLKQENKGVDKFLQEFKNLIKVMSRISKDYAKVLLLQNGA